MLSDFAGTIQIILIVIMLASILADIILSASWNYQYFTIGLPIFFMRVSVDNRHSNIPDHSLLEANFQSDWVASLAFHEISPGMFGFHEKIIQYKLISYTPLMHGLLVFDTDHGIVIVKGFINWSVLCIVVVGLGEIISVALPMIVYVLVFCFFGILYIWQALRFFDVGVFAVHSWSRQYLRKVDRA